MTGETIAIIPARGGSKRIPGKNLVSIAGLPLLAHSIRHARLSRSVDEVYVSTDDPEIAACASEYGAEVIERPSDLSGDTATSESALLHTLDERNRRGMPDPDLVVFLQATSPVRAIDDIDRAVRLLREKNGDSLFSGNANHRLFWTNDASGPKGLNWDFDRRPRDQDMADEWLENGAIYVFKPEVLRERGNRLGGTIVIYEMDHWSSFELDTPEDVLLFEWILTTVRPAAAPWPERIGLVVFDFDGVMTDNAAYVSGDGAESVRVDRSDGLGIARLREAGVPMVVLSTEEHPVVSARCTKLGIECRQGLADKGEALGLLLAERGVAASDAVYVGNDTNDLGCFELAGFPVAVSDAHPTVRARAALVLAHRGGRGAVREVCDLVLARLA